jgi:hypothetical protein
VEEEGKQKQSEEEEKKKAEAFKRQFMQALKSSKLSLL